MNEYLVQYDFTTFHSKGKFVGRSGQIGIKTDNTLEQVNHDVEQIKQLCVNYILSEKPKWNIFMITITGIQPQ